jgi:hypothetical protein
MRTEDVIEAYGHNRKAIAEALNISVSAVYQWGEIVPPHSAMRLALMRPELAYDPAQYRDWYSKFGSRKRKNGKRH